MAKLAEAQQLADELSPEEQERLLAYLIQKHDEAPSGPDTGELTLREAEMDSGAVQPLTEEEFFRQVKRQG